MRRSLWLLLVLFPGLFPAMSARAQPTPAVQTQITNLNLEMEQAMQKVRLIVNQRVPGYVRQRGMHVSVFSPGWFHEGAIRPDFSAVDIRTTQEKVYDGSGYVTSALNPNIVYAGKDLEFNSMTKYFYTDRTVPKKKLSEAEMVEINRLYRVIGHCEQELAALPGSVPRKETESDPASGSMTEAEANTTFAFSRIPRSRIVYGGLGLLAVLGLYGVYRKFAR